MRQLDLFAEPKARHDNPPTSSAAAAKVKPGNARRLTRIAEIVDESGYRGCTRDEVFQRFVLEEPNANPPTISGAVSRCADAGLIVPRGPKHVRLSLRNEPQTIYITPRWNQ